MIFRTLIHFIVSRRLLRHYFNEFGCFKDERSIETYSGYENGNTNMEIRWVISFCDDCDGDHRGFDGQVLSSAHLSSEEDAWSCKFLYFRNCF